MSGQRLITDIFAKHRREVDRSRKAKAADDEAKLAKPPAKKSCFEDLDEEAARALLREKELSVLQQFDLCWTFGPTIGITRLERWERAKKNNQNPPDLIRQIIQRNPEAEEYTQGLWHNYPL
ncbi:DNA polymerase delta subunit 4-like [Asterias rubens]|uniref:DNA polymerase delta subunit 4-like n=1 Tax=Asterias rubens TaxID=7604 RepID=UPI001455C8F2|nr:DNA polymerase delta subunit 4-like [Asterias rubens]